MKLMFLKLFCIFAITIADNVVIDANQYEPNWDSLDKRPLPNWYDEAKFGIFLHWGVYSVPSFGSEWFWSNWKLSNSSKYIEFMQKNYPPNFAYQDFGPQFTAEFFNATQWALLFKKSGAKYVVLTSKHHEGYTLWPSKYSFGWNAQDVGPHRDLIKELSEAIREDTDLRFGLYHSLYEWFNPMYLNDKRNNFATVQFVQNKVLPEMVELIEHYRPEVLWSDGEWEAKDTYWRSTDFIAWLYNESPVKDTIVVNDRWGQDILCKHGDFYTCSDRFNPGVLQKHKWENAMTVDKNSWGYRRDAKLEDFLSTHDLLQTMVETVSCGGNILMNVGPTKDGLIAPIFQERLTEVGEWLEVNGEAIYKTTPWSYQNDTNGYTWYTQNNNVVYAINLKWPPENELALFLASELFTFGKTVVTLLGDDAHLPWNSKGNSVNITFPDKATVGSKHVYVIKIEP